MAWRTVGSIQGPEGPRGPAGKDGKGISIAGQVDAYGETIYFVRGS